MMKRKGIPVWTWAALALMLGACAETIPHPDQGHARWAESHGLQTTLESLKEGRSRYVMKCDGCHSLYRPGKYVPEDWGYWVDSMQVEFRKAEGDLAPADARLIRNYLMASSGYLQDSLSATKALALPGQVTTKGE